MKRIVAKESYISICPTWNLFPPRNLSAGPFFTPALTSADLPLLPPPSLPPPLPLEGDMLLRRFEPEVPKTRLLCPVALKVVIESGFELDGSESSDDLRMVKYRDEI